MDFIESIKDGKVSQSVAEHIERLWREDTVRDIVRDPVNGISDSSPYFFDKVRTVADEEWLPTYNDILNLRVRTTGMVDQRLSAKDAEYNVFDVGGARNERKKWIHCFDNVSAVIFMASLACYDRPMFEDSDNNRMTDQLELFEQICKNRVFGEVPIFLVLNKEDLFAEKIKTSPINVCFPDYDGEEAVDFIRRKFLEHGRRGNVEREIRVHFANSMDKGSVERVFEDVNDCIMEREWSRRDL